MQTQIHSYELPKQSSGAAATVDHCAKSTFSPNRPPWAPWRPSDLFPYRVGLPSFRGGGGVKHRCSLFHQSPPPSLPPQLSSALLGGGSANVIFRMRLRRIQREATRCDDEKGYESISLINAPRKLEHLGAIETRRHRLDTGMHAWHVQDTGLLALQVNLFCNCDKVKKLCRPSATLLYSLF